MYIYQVLCQAYDHTYYRYTYEFEVCYAKPALKKRKLTLSQKGDTYGYMLVMVLKSLKIRPPLVRCISLFYNQTIFKKFECTFFDQVAIDAKTVLTFENYPLVAELKLKMSQNGLFFMFSISALPPEGAFQMLTHFWHLWPLGQKTYVQIFERQSGYKIIKQNVPEGFVF